MGWGLERLAAAAACVVVASACSALVGIGDLDVVEGDGGAGEGAAEGSPGADAHPDASDAGVDTAAVDAAEEEAGPTPCATQAGCGPGTDCIGDFCTPAPESCAALKTVLPADAGDGVYWIAPPLPDAGAPDAGADALPPEGPPIRAYCDMLLGADLCDERTAMHTGRMRDGSGIDWQTTDTPAAAPADAGDAGYAYTCTFGLVAQLESGYPFASTADLCNRMGFDGTNGAIGDCAYGPYAGSGCGYSVTGCANGTSLGGYWGYVTTCSGGCSSTPYYQPVCVSSGDAVTGGVCDIAH